MMFNSGSNHSINNYILNGTELINTDSYYAYYIDLILNTLNRTNSFDHAIYETTSNHNYINNNHQHQQQQQQLHQQQQQYQNNHKITSFYALNSSHTHNSNLIHKLKRFAYFLSFFLLFLFLISLLSRLYACTTRMKSRKKRYGYYFHFKIETYMNEIKHKLKYKQFKLSNNLIEQFKTNKQNTQHQQQTTEESSIIYIQDQGHINESYEPNLEQLIYEEPQQNTEMNLSPIRSQRKSNFLSAYFETKRANSFEYEKFIDDDSESIRSNRFSFKYFKRPQLKHDTSLPLFTISNTNNKLFKQITRSTTSFINFSKSKSSSSSSTNNTSDTSSVATNSTGCTMTTFEIPVILVTDTAKMQTSIIDLDTFEPEKYYRPNYVFNDHRT